MAHGNKHGNKKNKGGGNNLHHLLSFLDVGKPLQGKDLYKAAKAEAKIQTKPQVDAYKRLAKQLKAQEKFDTKGLKRLGNKTAGAVGDVYQNLGSYSNQAAKQTSAIGQQLVNRTNAAGQASAQGLAEGQSTQLSGFLSSQKRAGGTAPTSTAQQQLAQIVANQQQSAQADSRAASALAGSQAASSTQLARNMGTSAQLQGATAISGIRSGITSRIGAQKLQAQQDISEARGKAADARALKGSAIISALQQLRGQEQQYKLGKMATNQRAQAAQLSAATSIANSKRTAASSAASTAASLKNSRRTNRRENRQFNKTHTASGKSKGTQGGSSSSSDNSHATKHAHQRAVQHLLSKLSGTPKGQVRKNRSKAVNILLAGAPESYSRKEAEAAVRKYLGGGGKKGGGKKKKPNPHAI